VKKSFLKKSLTKIFGGGGTYISTTDVS